MKEIKCSVSHAHSCLKSCFRTGNAALGTSAMNFGISLDSLSLSIQSLPSGLHCSTDSSLQPESHETKSAEFTIHPPEGDELKR